MIAADELSVFGLLRTSWWWLVITILVQYLNYHHSCHSEYWQLGSLNYVLLYLHAEAILKATNLPNLIRQY